MKKLVICSVVLAIAAFGFYLFSISRVETAPAPMAAANDEVAPASSEPTPGVSKPRMSQPPMELSLLAKFRNCLADPSEENRRATFLQLLLLMQATDTRQVMDLLEEVRKGGKDLTFEQDAFWHRRGELDPEQALADLEGLARDAQGELAMPRIAGAMKQLFRGWASSDLQAAAKWINENQNHPRIRDAFAGFLDTVARSDPAKATQMVFSMLKPDDPRLGYSVSSLFNAVVESGSMSAADWYQQLPTDEAGIKARQSIALRMVGKLLNEDPATARTWAKDQADKPWRSWQAIDNVANSYAATDPAAAMAWIANNAPDPDNGSVTGVGMVVRRWANQDAGALENWIASNQGVKSRLLSQVLGDYAAILAPVDYNKALGFFNQIPDEYPQVRANFGPRVRAFAPRVQPQQ